jgi:pyruvate,water dikinase
MIYAEKSEETSSERTINKPTSIEKQIQFSLNDKEVINFHNGVIKLKNIIKEPMDMGKKGKQSALYCSERPENSSWER